MHCCQRWLRSAARLCGTEFGLPGGKLGWAPFYLGTVAIAIPGVRCCYAMRGTIHRYEAEARAGN